MKQYFCLSEHRHTESSGLEELQKLLKLLKYDCLPCPQETVEYECIPSVLRRTHTFQ